MSRVGISVGAAVLACLTLGHCLAGEGLGRKSAVGTPVYLGLTDDADQSLVRHQESVGGAYGSFSDLAPATEASHFAVVTDASGTPEGWGDQPMVPFSRESAVTREQPASYNASWLSDSDTYEPVPDLSGLQPQMMDATSADHFSTCDSCGDLWSTTCDSCDSGHGCSNCGSRRAACCPTCCDAGMHCTFVYGEFLYLRPRNAEVAYAVPADGPIAGGQPAPIQVGSLGILDPDFDIGFRAGASVALDTLSSIDVRYTMFESATSDEIEARAPNVLRSLVTHPSTATAAVDALAGIGSLSIDFDTVDVSYRHLLNCGGLTTVNYVVGGRYANLEQQFAAQFIKNGTEYVTTDIDFDGGGMRLGLEAVRWSCRNCLNLYANGSASFLAGRFRGHYFQGDSFDPEVVNTEWEAGRIVPILDLECGLGWTSASGRLGFSAGYLVSSWFNTVTTQDLIDAVQRNSFLGMSESITFDGLQARFHYRF